MASDEDGSGSAMAAAGPPAPSWSTGREALALCARPAQVRRTGRIALIVGTILSLVNQSGVIFGGDADAVTWLRVGANYVVPYCVATAGFLTGTRVKRSA